ncbi:hypothetical protein Trydic_g8949 [Trypoxylus dichotomus]
MWKIALLVMFSCIVCSKSRPVSPIDSSFLYPGSLYNTRPEDLDRIDEDAFRQLYFFYRPSKRGETYDLELALPQPKRAFSMLARWRPFNSIGKNRSSIREHNNLIAAKPVTDFDIVSAETRAFLRPVGQPLRWG